MAQTNYTPIQLYYSSTAAATPSAGNLANGELALNITDGKLFYKDNGGTVRVLATKAGASGDVVGPASATDNALARFDTTTGKLIQNSAGILSDAGALSGLTDISASGSVTLSGGTANGVAYLNGSKVLATGSALKFDGATLTNGGNIVALGGDFSGIGAAGYVQLRAGSSDTNSYIIRGASAGARHEFVINGSERMRLTDTGLGIGTSSPGSKLDVNGGLIVRGSVAPLTYSGGEALLGPTTADAYSGVSTQATGSPILYFDHRGTSNTGFFRWRNGSGGGATLMTLDASGSLLVGLTSATGVAKLQVSGPLRTTGYTVATLPAGTVGMRTYVTDALGPVALATVAGGGSSVVPVFYNGTNWIVG